MHYSNTLIECDTEISNKMCNSIKIFRIGIDPLGDDICAVDILGNH